MLIFLLRHGATPYNAEHRYQGQSDIPLSPAGRAALRQADFSPERVYVSPLSRAAETARILFPAARLVPLPALREMDFGVFEGRSYREMEHDRDYRSWVESGCTGQCPGGESRAAFSDRVCAAFAPLVDRALDAGTERLAIVAHGGVQMAALERFATPRRDYFHWGAPCGGGFVLDAAAWRETRLLTLRGTVCYAKD